MPKVGNYRDRNERMSLKEFNESWRARRRDTIQQTKALRAETANGVFGTNVAVFQQQVYNSIAYNSTGGSTSRASAMSRLNLLV